MASVVFLVRDIKQASAYYVDALAFTYEEIGVGPILHVHLSCPDADLTIILHEARNPNDVRPFSGVPGGPPWDAFAYPRNVKQLYDTFVQQEAEIAYDHMGDPFWSEFAVRDVDGYVVAYGGRLTTR